MAELQRQVRIRGGHRAAATRIINAVNVLLEAKPTAERRILLRQKLNALQRKLDTIQTLDEIILELVNEEIENEIVAREDVEQVIEECVARLEAALEDTPAAVRNEVPVGQRKDIEAPSGESVSSTRPPSIAKAEPEMTVDLAEIRAIFEKRSSVDVEETQSLASSKTTYENVESRASPVLLPSEGETGSSYAWKRPSTRRRVKLPKMDLPKFDGTVTKWTPFWDSFAASIDDDEELSLVDKFNYLSSCLSGEAARAVAGLSLTAANYTAAIGILKERFGNKQLIISQLMDGLLNLSPLSSGENAWSTRQLRVLYDDVESCIRSLEGLGVSSATYGTLLSSILMNKLPADLRLIISRQLPEVEDALQVQRVMDALQRELKARERATTAPSKQTPSHGPGHRQERTTTSSLVADAQPQLRCVYCQGNHNLGACRKVLGAANRMQALRQAGRCFTCLRRGYLARDCLVLQKCATCGGSHHNSLCFKLNSKQDRAPEKPNTAASVTATPPMSTSRAQPEQHHAQCLTGDSRSTVLLQTAKAAVCETDGGTLPGRILLDSGSQCTYVTEEFRQRLKLKTIGSSSVMIRAFGSDGTETASDLDRVELQVETRTGKISMVAYVVRTICEPLARQYVAQTKSKYQNLQNVFLADYQNGKEALKVDILVGADQYWKLVTGRVIQAEEGPTAIQTKLGWVLSGPTSAVPVQAEHNTLTTHVLKCSHDASATLGSLSVDDSDRLDRFWKLESIGILDQSVHEQFNDQISQKEGRYEVNLPWKATHPLLPDNYALCAQRLKVQQKKFELRPSLEKEYDAVINQQLASGVIEVVHNPEEGEPGRVHYLPHHAVIRENKETTKVRVVYDASAKCGEGPSLNECLHAGPPLLQDILDILVRFRKHKVALAGDVEKAFLMIGIAPKDRDVLQFLWSDDSVGTRTLRFTRVPLGLTCSPFLLNATVQFYLNRYRAEDPLFVDKVLRLFYIDDLSTGDDTVDRTYELYTKTKTRMATGSFNLRKFVTNSSELRKRIAENEVDSSDMEESTTYCKTMLGANSTATSEEAKILGIRWNFIEDNFIFDLTEVGMQAAGVRPTKRNVVSIAGRFFDPLGFYSPSIVQFKMFLQELCKEKIDWDTTLTGDLLARWKQLVEAMHSAPPLVLSRCYFTTTEEPARKYTLHGFCDASESAYAAVVYLREETSARVSFVAAKTRVAPLATLTIPRLELLSALILSRLICRVRDALKHEMEISEVVCWSDSEVAWHWIKRECRSWKQFVQNRVDEIRSLVPVEAWRHCPGEENPADIPSRGMSPSRLAKTQRWLGGPEWLSSSSQSTVLQRFEGVDAENSRGMCFRDAEVST